ncbi:MAG: ESPR domain-containing protein, partial [Succiniclasticum sp.]|uniref:ESPR domain-containing protein n=1 Tax=Succiniclasticum sp. TaxID=2775030 RepID=UPI002A92090D
MNKIYKVVWSKVKHCYVVTSELAKRNGKGCGARSLRMAAVTLGVAAALMGGVGFGTPAAWAEGASDNTLTVTSGKGSSVYGGIAGGSDPGADYRGGWSSNDADDANGNTITININYSTVNGRVFGGSTYSGAASNNRVTVTSGTVNDRVIGGNTSSGDASNNTVTISGTVEDWVLGGSTYSGAATDNTVTISGGTIDSVHGGYSSAISNDNTVTVSGGTVGTSADNYAVVGAGNSGSDENPVASGNNVSVAGTAQVTGLVIGARDAYGSAVITDNTVTIDGSAVVTGDVIGGYGWGKDKTLNKVYVKGGTVTGNVYGVELNSSNSGTGNATSNEVHISGGTVSGSVYGGAMKGKVSGNANSNKVVISGGEVKTARAGSGDSVYGGYSETGNANSNKVQVSGESTVKLTVYGGVTKYTEGTASDNEVTVSDSANLPSGITAGWSPNKDAKNNTVTIEGGTVQGYINGGVATGAADNNHIIVNGGKVSYLQGGSGGSSATGNTVEINGGKVTDTIYGGNSGNGTVTGNTVTVNGGTVSTIYGGYSNNGTVTGNTVNVVSEAVLDGAVYGGMNGTGDANGNTVSITGGTVGGAVWGGYSRNGDAKNNTVTVTDMAAGRAIYGGYAENSVKDATGNTVTIKNVTATAAYHNLEGGYTNYTTTPTGDFVTGNTLIISGANKFGGVIDNFETIKLANDFAWKNGATVLQGKFGVNYDGTRPALDITDAKTALSSATSGSMTLLASSSANDFSTLSLKYSGGSATLNASKPSQEVLSGEGSASEDKGVTVTSSTKHTVSLDQANSYKNVLYTVETGLASKISLGDMAWETPRALSGFTFGTTATVDAADLTFTGKSTTPLQVNDSRTLVSGATGIASLPAANITQPGTGKGTVAIEHTDANGLKFNATATGTVGVAGTDVKYTVTGVTADSIDLSGWKGTTASTVPTGWTGAGIAVSGSFTEPEMEVNSKKDIVTGAASGFFTEAGIADAIKYKEGASFTGDKANGVTLAGKQSKGVQAADSGKKLVYAVGAKEVTEVSLGNMAAGTPRTMEDGYDFAGVTTINAGSLQFDKPEDVKADATLVANAVGLAAGKEVTGADHTQSFTKTAENQVVLFASLKGTVETAANAVNYTYGGTELTKVDLANWNGASSDASSVTDGWTLGTGASVTTGDLSKADLTLLKPGETKTILTVGDTIEFTDAMISGAKKWQDGGPIDDSANTSGVTIAGSTTGGGVKVNDSNAHQLIYQQDKKEVT